MERNPSGESPLLSPIDMAAVRAEAERVRAMVLAYPAVDMLGALVCHASWAHMKSEAYEFPQVEYAALIYWHEEQDRDECRSVGAAALEEVVKEIDRLFFLVQRYFSSEADRASARGEQPDLAYRLRSAGLGIRVPAYDVHQYRVLRGIFGGYAAEIEARLGFNVEHVIATIIALANHYDKAMYSFNKVGRSLNSLESVERHISDAGNFLAFDVSKISTLAGLPLKIVSAILKEFSLKRGESDRHALIPSPFSKLRQRPILAIGDGRYFVPSHALLLPSVQSRIEELLNPAITKGAAHGLWVSYEKHRGKWVEQESYRLLEEMMPGGKGMVGAYYYPIDGQRVEGDVVYQVDDAVFLLEGKSGAFAPAALRGAADSLSDDIKEIIAKGHDQCARTEAYMRNVNNIFENEDGTPGLTIAGKVGEFIRIVITLDNVGVLATASAGLQRAGYLQGEPTWTLSLTDFMILADVLSEPGELRHYARERYRNLLREHLLTHDETDYLGIYLLYGKTTVMEDEADTVVFTGHMEQFDNYYVKGISKKPPRQKIPVELRELIKSLARGNAAHWSHAVCDIFGLDADSRKAIAKGIGERVKDCSMHSRDVTMIYGGNKYMTILLRERFNPDKLREIFLYGLNNSPNRVYGKRLFIGYDPGNGIATAEYYQRVDDRHFRVLPSLSWSSNVPRV